MNVYIVLKWKYDCYEVDRVFLKRKEAIKYRDEKNAKAGNTNWIIVCKKAA